MKEPDRIKQFLSESLGVVLVDEWQQKPNGQLLLQLRAHGITVNYYTTTRKVLWQGRSGSQYEEPYERWAME